MKEYDVKITDRALQDMAQIYTYIAEQLGSPENGMKQYNRIAQSITTLSVLPERIKLMESEPERQAGFRQLLIDHYSVFFMICDETVIVIRVLYSASDISQRLKEG